MKKIVLLENESEKEKKFFEILFDERLAEDTFLVPKSEFYKVGGINSRIGAKQQYELLLRFAESYYVEIEDCSMDEKCLEDHILIEYRKTDSDWEEIAADCYIISKYKDKLLSYGCFDVVLQSVLDVAELQGLRNEAVCFLEKMLKREEEYYRIDDAVRPILIYKGEGICYNVLNLFAEQFGEAFKRAGHQVEYFDSEKEGVKAITKYIGRRYQAIVGMQTYLFSITMQDGTAYLHDRIYGPKFNFIFDHPIWIKKHLTQSPKDLKILTHDIYYVKFCEQYYGKKAYLFPPAGNIIQVYEEQKRYDISFVGSFGDYWNEVLLIHQMDRNIRFLANRFLLKMRKEPNKTADEVFRKVLDENRNEYTDEEYMDLFFQCRRVIYCVMHYYRIKVMKTFIQAGYRVDVFGSSWERCYLKQYPNLICHPDISAQECISVWQQSKISLNVMSWHKGGFTERMSNIMLCGTVLLTDDSGYLDGRFKNGEDLLVFQLDGLKKLPSVLGAYLNSPKKLQEIAENGRKKAEKYHTWDSRAKEFLEKIL